MPVLDSWKYGDPAMVAERNEQARINREEKAKRQVAALFKTPTKKPNRSTLRLTRKP